MIIKINSIDRTSLIDWKTVDYENVLTNEVDTCSFEIRNIGGVTYKPDLDDEVEIWDDANKIFAGSIVSIVDKIDRSKKLRFFIRCKDWTGRMDKRLVVESYEEKTVNYIIGDINAKYLDGFTTTNVDCPIEIKYIAFNYQQPSRCFKRLADLTGYDWYVDEIKDIHFFAKEDNPAPFNLTDDSGNYVFDSLEIKRDISQLRNTIYVRGGSYQGDIFTESYKANGEAKTFPLTYKYANISVKVNSVSQTVGIDFIDDPATKDCLYNFHEKIIKFRDDNKPLDKLIVEISGNPYYPLLVKNEELGSISKYGPIEGKVIDKSIKSKDGARETAKAEISKYGIVLDEGSFETDKSGLRSGQQILISSVIRGISAPYVISKVKGVLKTPDKFTFGITIITKKLFDFIELLQKILEREVKEIEVTEPEILDRILTAYEYLNLQEQFTYSVDHNRQTESLNLEEVLDVRGLDYPVQFVLGPWINTATKKQFLLNGSPLA